MLAVQRLAAAIGVLGWVQWSGPRPDEPERSGRPAGKVSATPASATAVNDGRAVAVCRWCQSPLQGRRLDTVFCARKCRQAAWRLGRRSSRSDVSPMASAGAFAYADPPYPGLAAKYYRRESSYGGEVDHAALIQSLEAGGYVGWALSTSAKALRDVLPLCPPGAHVCPWVKPIGVPARTCGLHTTWEPLIVVGGRQRQPGVRDWLRAMPARNWGTLPGRKPIAFCAFLFDALGMMPGDSLVDLFPGSGAVGRAWRELSSRSSATSSPTRRLLPAIADASATAAGDEFDVS